MTAALTAVLTPYIMVIVSAPGGVDPIVGNGCARGAGEKGPGSRVQGTGGNSCQVIDMIDVNMMITFCWQIPGERGQTGFRDVGRVILVGAGNNCPRVVFYVFVFACTCTLYPFTLDPVFSRYCSLAE